MRTQSMNGQECPECRWVPVVDAAGRRRLEMRWAPPLPAAGTQALGTRAA